MICRSCGKEVHASGCTSCKVYLPDWTMGGGHRVIAFDPGLSCTGVAWCSGTAWGVQSVRSALRNLPQRIEDILGKLGEFRTQWDAVIIEKPQVYQGHKQKGDPNDLIDLAVLVGALLRRFESPKIYLPRPIEWKRQIPKEIHHRRIREDAKDRGWQLPARISKDAMDAVGLLFYGLKRSK